MRVVAYPADRFGCGHFRMIWPAEALRDAGHDVSVVDTRQRRVQIHIKDNEVVDADVNADVVVFQRITHRYMADAVPVLRRKGVSVVVDIDDDLTSVHPSNPAWQSMHPRNEGRKLADGNVNMHSWRNLNAACRDATLVTVSTPALLSIYAAHGRGAVLPNYLPDAYDNVAHVDSDVIGWPASFHSHPNDPDALGGAVARVVADGAEFRMVGDPSGAGVAFGIGQDPPGKGVPIEQWPTAVSSLGVGIAPLADTRFNRSKSWLKPLEMSAVGVPWVASPRVEYQRLHKMGAGVLAERPRAWYKELSRLRTDAALRQEVSEAGRAVASQLRLTDHAWKWMEAWGRAHEIQRTSSKPFASVR